jgi:outer membrane receptor for ferrienterochelin and colicin
MVVTATGFSQERREAPATISVLDEKALNTRSNQNVTEALREMPGVLVGNGHGSLATGDVQMRGMDSTYTSFMVNGIKQSTRESRPYGHHIGSEAAFMPPLAAIERVEVIRGPMSSLYGSDSIGGVVNVITKRRITSKNGRGCWRIITSCRRKANTATLTRQTPSLWGLSSRANSASAWGLTILIVAMMTAQPRTFC